MPATTRPDGRTWKARGLAPQHDQAIRVDDARRRRRARLWAVALVSGIAGAGYGVFRLTLDAEASPVVAAVTSGQVLLADVREWWTTQQPVAVATAPAAEVPSAATVTAALPAPKSPAEPPIEPNPAAIEKRDETEPAKVAALTQPTLAAPVRPPEPVVAAPVILTIPIPVPTPTQPVVSAIQPPPPPVPAVAPCRAEVAPAVAQAIVWFPLASADLQPAQREMLRDVGRRIAACQDARVEIGGHTDVLGADGQNFQLSWRRAETVLAVLRESGVSAEQAIVVGHGARVPFQAARGAPDPNALNRRVEFTLR